MRIGPAGNNHGKCNAVSLASGALFNHGERMVRIVEGAFVENQGDTNG